MVDQHKIVFDARLANEGRSGVRRYIRSLLQAIVPLLDSNEELHVLYSQGTEDWLCPQYPVKLHYLPAGIRSWSSHWQTFRLLQKLKPEVTHTPTIFTPIHIPGRIILTVHDFMPFSHPKYNSFFSRWRYRMAGKKMMRKARKIIGCSQDALHTAEKFFGHSVTARGTVIPFGIDPIFQKQSEEKIRALHQDYDLPEKFLLYVGSDAPHKNLETILHAIAMIEATACPPLVVAGFESKESPLRSLAEDLEIQDRIHWLPRIKEEDLPTLYSAAETFLFPSLVEGFCFPVLESMACGTPVICSALPVLKELTGEAAKIVHPTDPHEWARAINSSIVSIDWHDIFQAKGIARAAEFKWEKTAQLTLETWRSLYPKH